MDFLECLAETRTHQLCTSCLGRLFGRLGYGLSNAQRGQALLAYRAMTCEAAGESGDGPFFHDGNPPPNPVDCELCQGLLEEVAAFAELVEEALEPYQLANFKVGCVIDAAIVERERKLQEAVGTRWAEPLKVQLNREIGFRVAGQTDLSAQLDNPDAVAVIDTRYDTVKLSITSLFIEGRYTKHSRELPQTRWPCRRCNGLGCDRCHGTGQMYPESVQSLVAEPALELTQARTDLFHGLGREDIDARMLGDGRPFVLELRDPKVRDVDLALLETEVAARSDGRVTVQGLHPVPRSRVAELKATRCDKTYLAQVVCEPAVDMERLKNGAARLSGTVVEQRTPARVSHRRADRVRRRLVHTCRIRSSEGETLELEVRAEHGTYIKELMSGDGGRTTPSLSALVEAACRVTALDVLALHLHTPEEQA